MVCPECGTANAIGSRFCETCGLVLTARHRREARARRAAPAAAPDRDEQREIERTLVKARQVLRNVRILYGVLAALSLLSTTGFLFAWIGLMSDGAEERFTAAWMFALSFVCTALLVVALFLLFVNPLFFTISIACLTTLVAAPLLLDFFSNPVAAVVYGTFALSCWGAVPLMLNVSRLKQKYPELITSAKLKSREKRAGVETAAARVRSIEREAGRRRAAFKTLAVVAGIVVLVVVSIVVATSVMSGTNPNQAATRRPSYTAEQLAAIKAAFRPRVDEFRTVWNANDRHRISELLEDGFRARMWGKLLRSLKRHEYVEEMPRIEVPEVFPRNETEKDAWYDIKPFGTVKTRWRYHDDEWVIIKLAINYKD